MTHEVREKAKVLGLARFDRANKKVVVEELQKALENTPEFKALKTAQDEEKELASIEATAYTALITEMLKGKKPAKFEDVGSVQNWTEYQIDEAKTLAWAIEKQLPTLLKLNNSEVKRIANTLSPDGVTIKQGLKAKVNKDLSILFK